jgi:nitrate/nitrite transporter NarK
MHPDIAELTVLTLATGLNWTTRFSFYWTAMTFPICFSIWCLISHVYNECLEVEETKLSTKRQS